MISSCWIDLLSMEIIRETQSDFMGFFFSLLLVSRSFTQPLCVLLAALYYISCREQQDRNLMWNNGK